MFLQVIPEGDIIDAGIWGGTGPVALVEGDVFVGYMSDIMSIVDKKEQDDSRRSLRHK